MEPSGDLKTRRRRVVETLRGHERIVVALSGGVDSAVLLALAVEALGVERVTAITGTSPAVTSQEVDDARRVAHALSVPHELVETHEFDNPDYRANRDDRCFHCRSELFKVIAALRDASGSSTIAYGAIVDDLGEDRPGMRAAQNNGVIAPLLDGGLSKGDVREIARELAIPVGDKPANACLASRIPTGTPVTAERLQQVAAAEAALRELGFAFVRVRHHGPVARLEVPVSDVSRVTSAGLRDAVAEAVRAAGFDEAAVDLEGYRPAGSTGRTAPRLYSIAPARDGGQ